MAPLFSALYLIFFTAIVGGEYVLMTINLRRRTQLRSKHPEAPKPGDTLLYVDLSRERLEEIYNRN
jgi:hypothetical protein